MAADTWWKQTQNKPNLPEGKIDAKSVFTKDYEEKCGYGLWKNKANSNPISERPKMNVNLSLTKDYRKKDDFSVRKNKPNSNPIKPNCRKGKIDAKSLFTKDYEEKCG